jgi:GMP synthase (glutamine-hydrolysing)
MGMTAVILIHESEEGPGLLEPALRGAGFRLVRRYRQVQPADREAALVVAMGGPMAAYESNRYPFLAEELELLKGRLAQGRLCLGICLGAQLLASAAGARVYLGGNGPELGVFPVSLTTQAATDPVFKEFPDQLSFAHWHQDTFDLVPGAVHLAFSERYPNQAYRIGGSYGFQFHPEADATLFGQWILSSPAEVEVSGRSARQLAAEDLPKLRSAEPLLEKLLARLAKQLAASCSKPELD